ncbi:MAG: class I SAM-dependent methyltransferase [Acidimicrobiales bacterium]
MDSRIAERDFNHAYDSCVEDGNGEDFFLDLVDGFLTPTTRLLDVGCGHGELTLDLAPRVRSTVGIDRTAQLIELARELAAERKVDNVRFKHAELAAPGESHAGGPLPLDDDSIDVVVDRRGPSVERFVDDLQRVGYPGTTIVGLHPAGGPPPPPWADDVPALRERFNCVAPATVAAWVVQPAEKRGLRSYRLWWIDVPEHLPDPKALYDKLCRDGTPPFETVIGGLEEVFRRHAGADGVVLRHQRLVFTLTI